MIDSIVTSSLQSIVTNYHTVSTLSHTYRKVGTFTIRVTLTDEDGNSNINSDSTAIVTVNNIQPVISISGDTFKYVKQQWQGKYIISHKHNL